MILRNHEIVDLKEDIVLYYDEQGEPVTSTLEKELQDIRKEKTPFVLRSNIKPTFTRTSKGAVQKDYEKQGNFKLDSQWDGELWQYVTPGRRVMGKDGYEIKDTRRMRFKGEALLDPKRDTELIFYLKYRSSKFQKGKIFFHDEEVLEEKKAELNEMEALAKYYIFSADSPISFQRTGSEQAMKQLASSYDIHNVSGLSYTATKNAIWDLLQRLSGKKKDNPKYYKDFVKQVEMRTDVSKTANVNQAIQLGILIYNPDTREWSFKEKGGSEKKLVTAPIDEINNYKDCVVRYLIDTKNAYWYDQVKASLDDNAYERIPQSIIAGFEEEYSFLQGEITRGGDTDARFQDLCNKHNVRFAGVKKDEYEKELREKCTAVIEGRA
jgi:hypothetical protein